MSEIDKKPEDEQQGEKPEQEIFYNLNPNPDVCPICNNEQWVCNTHRDHRWNYECCTDGGTPCECVWKTGWIKDDYTKQGEWNG